MQVMSEFKAGLIVISIAFALLLSGSAFAADCVPSSGKTCYTYDEQNRLKRVDYPDGSYINYDYDKIGNISSKETYWNNHTLTVRRTGEGGGTVTSDGISCGLDCSEEFSHGASVTLSATPPPCSSFAGWSGGGCSGIWTCSVTMNDSKTVTAAFDLATTTDTTNTDCTQCTGANQSCVEGQCTYGWNWVPVYDCWECDVIYNGAYCYEYDDWIIDCWAYLATNCQPDRCTTTTSVCPVCGNGICESSESSSTCPADCGSPPLACGDGWCDCSSEYPGADCGDCGSWDDYEYYCIY